MKMNFLAVLAGAALLAAGCASTVTDQHTFASTWSKDTITARYPRTTDQVYHAATYVVSQDGRLTREFITPGTNVVRSLEGKVNQRTVWVAVAQEDPKITDVTVQTRTQGGISDIDLAAQIDKQIALKLAR